MTRSKAVIINVSLGADQLKVLDEWVEKTRRNRSEFIREAIRKHIVELKREGL